MIFNLLTAVLIVLKLMGLIAISWFVVFLPSLLVLAFFMFVFVIWAMK